MSHNQRFSISLRVNHPRIRHEEISSCLSLAPLIAHSVGDNRSTPKGRALAGVWPATFWTAKIDSCDSLESTLLHVVVLLESHRDFVLRLTKTGGSVEIFIGIFLSQPYGFSVSSDLIRRIAELSVFITFDIYP